MPDRFRPNVAVIVTDGLGNVLMCRRTKDIRLPQRHEYWQTVQGGGDEGESVIDTAIRETWEEIGVPPEQITIIDVMPTKFVYRFDDDYIAKFIKDDIVGQEQTFVLAQIDHDQTFNLHHHHQEFAEVKWGSPADLIAKSWPTKVPGLRAAFIHFGLLIE